MYNKSLQWVPSRAKKSPTLTGAITMAKPKITEAKQAAAVLVSKMHDAKQEITLLENGIIEASNKEGTSAKDYAAFMDKAFPAAQTPMAWCDVKKSHKSDFGQFVWASRTRIVEQGSLKRSRVSTRIPRLFGNEHVKRQSTTRRPRKKRSLKKLISRNFDSLSTKRARIA